MKKSLITVFTIIIAVSSVFAFAGCEYTNFSDKNWATKFDASLPSFEGSGFDADNANSEGWYMTLLDNFDGNTLNNNTWATADHGPRVGGHWCDKMVEVDNGILKINAKASSNYDCTICPKSGLYTGGVLSVIRTGEGAGTDLFTQAFGYYEVRAKLPKSGGMWSAFWLSSRNINSEKFAGEDGSEIDVFESSFYNTKQSNVTHAIHYDGYAKKHKCGSTIRQTNSNLYTDNDGWHTYALKWTNDCYVFYVDGEATWATDFGGVSEVASYLLLTCEIKDNGVGPAGQKLGKFEGDTFAIDYVKVYQNKEYLQYIKNASDFVA